MIILFPTIILLLFDLTAAKFHPHFMNFLIKEYGPKIANSLSRSDLDERSLGSFGGGPSTSQVRPVILIHGLDSEAGSYAKALEEFPKYGIPAEKIFATTYGPGMSPALITSAASESMKCEYVAHIRRMIDAVTRYHKSEVDIIAYSMGSPLARKAILGGICVDTNDDLGSPFTQHVHTFVSVAGANRGSYICEIPLMGACNAINGMHCHSKFIDDINDHHYYEGTKVYNLYSDLDPIIGLYTCGYQATGIAGGEDVKMSGLTHKAIQHDTLEMQAKLLRIENMKTYIAEKKEEAALKFEERRLFDQARRRAGASRKANRLRRQRVNRKNLAKRRKQIQKMNSQLRRLDKQIRFYRKSLRVKTPKHYRRHRNHKRRHQKRKHDKRRRLTPLQKIEREIQLEKWKGKDMLKKINYLNRLIAETKRRSLPRLIEAEAAEFELEKLKARTLHSTDLHPVNEWKSIHFETSTTEPSSEVDILRHGGETPQPVVINLNSDEHPKSSSRQELKDLVAHLADESEESETVDYQPHSKFVPNMQELNEQ